MPRFYLMFDSLIIAIAAMLIRERRPRSCRFSIDYFAYLPFDALRFYAIVFRCQDMHAAARAACRHVAACLLKDRLMLLTRRLRYLTPLLFDYCRCLALRGCSSASFFTMFRCRCRSPSDDYAMMLMLLFFFSLFFIIAAIISSFYYHVILRRYALYLLMTTFR